MLFQTLQAVSLVRWERDTLLLDVNLGLGDTSLFLPCVLVVKDECSFTGVSFGLGDFVSEVSRTICSGERLKAAVPAGPMILDSKIDDVTATMLAFRGRCAELTSVGSKVLRAVFNHFRQSLIGSACSNAIFRSS